MWVNEAPHWQGPVFPREETKTSKHNGGVIYPEAAASEGSAAVIPLRAPGRTKLNVDLAYYDC